MSQAAAVRLRGLLDAPGELTVAQLRDLPVHRVEATFDCLGSGKQRHGFEGHRLWDVIRTAEPRVDLVGRKQRLRLLLTVTGADGHLAALSWAEIDPDFGGQQILLATSIDGTPWTAPALNWSSPPTAAAPATSAASPTSGSSRSPIRPSACEPNSAPAPTRRASTDRYRPTVKITWLPASAACRKKTTRSAKFAQV
ncbi:hypothetical protein ACWCYY_12770 [Kitasatospora sp. NPDC001664]